MIVKMELISDMIFGNGESIPGAEDISVLHDANGFPYYKGGTFKGVFREELKRYLEFNCSNELDSIVTKLLGVSGGEDYLKQIVFSDFVLSDNVKGTVLKEVGENNVEAVLDITTHLRTFTKINENGIVARGSLRMARCIDKGLCFYSKLSIADEYEDLVKNVLLGIKWLGTMRNRGFGKVKLTVLEEVQ